MFNENISGILNKLTILKIHTVSRLRDTSQLATVFFLFSQQQQILTIIIIVL